MPEEEKLDWYVVHTYSGYENKVMDSLRKTVENRNMHDLITEIRVPTETVTEIKDNKKRDVERKIFPGYVLVRMEMDDDAWTCVRNTPGVTGFLGAANKPAPLSREEFNKIMKRSDSGKQPKRTAVGLEVGTPVRVISGPLADFDGQIAEVNADAGKVKVMLLIFGRETSVELAFDQVAVIS